MIREPSVVAWNQFVLLAKINAHIYPSNLSCCKTRKPGVSNRKVSLCLLLVAGTPVYIIVGTFLLCIWIQAYIRLLAEVLFRSKTQRFWNR